MEIKNKNLSLKSEKKGLLLWVFCLSIFIYTVE